ncbi:hypothetical protein VTG60DRAFT_670 [Thermothelomyces hinnuleus]
MKMASKTVHIPLNTMDHMPPPNYSNFIYYLPLKPGVSAREAFEFLQKGLQITFARLPWLAGKVFPASPTAPNYRPGLLEIRYDLPEGDATIPLHQFRFKELESSLTYNEIRETDFHPETFDDATVTWAPYLPDVTKGADVFVAQANALPGGIVLTMAICHVVSDGVGIMNAARAWANGCRELHLGASHTTLPPQISDHEVLERACDAYEGQTKKSADQFPPESWRLLNMEPPYAAGQEEPAPAPAPASFLVTKSSDGVPRMMKSYLFYIPPAKVAALRENCIRELGGDVDLSINDVVCALIWRSLLKARVSGARDASKCDGAPAADGNTSPNVRPSTFEGVEARLQLPFDARPYLSHDVVPSDYMGNFTMMNQVVLPLADLVAPSTSVASVARTIREGAKGITAERLMEAYALLRTLFQNGKPSMKLNKTLAVGGTGLIITSLVAFPLSDLCFEPDETRTTFFGNGGKPEAMRTLMGAINQVFRYGAVLPRKQHGGIEFAVNALDEEFDALMRDEELCKYALLME